MEQTSIRASMGSARDLPMLSALPAWVDRRSCMISEPPGSVRLAFYCCCSVKKVRCTVKVGRSAQESATKLADKVQAAHSACQPIVNDRGTTDAPPAPAADPSVRAKQLEATILSQKRKVVCVESALDRANAKAVRGANAVQSQAEHKRQESIGDSRRVKVDQANKEGFTPANKSTALNAERTGILACIRYWAQGSVQKVFELVMAIMTTFGLKERVADELGVEAVGTNAAIVTRLHDSVQILKACSSEEQRQQYRVLLTAAAPEKAHRTDSTGMGNKFADALQVNRKSVPYLDSIAKRAEIDDAAKIQKREIAFGD
jgi:hypothetical protein